MITKLTLCFLTVFIGNSLSSSFGNSEGFYGDMLLREMVARMGNDLVDRERDYIELPSQRMSMPIADGISSRDSLNPLHPVLDYDDLALSPSLRDREYLAHSSLLGTLFNPYGGENKSLQRLKPTTTGIKMASELKTDGVLPAYCNPPNPCPLGYTAKDGCLDDFENTAGFSRDYQAMQECMCDSEHMFQCPSSSRDSEITVLSRSIQNEGALDATLDKIMSHLNYNPYLEGDKLPIAAKKGNLW